MRIGILDDRCERRSASRQVRTKGGRFRSDTGSFAIADGSATIAVSSKLAREAYEADPHQCTAIDRQCHAGDEIGLVKGEKQRCIRDVPARSHAPAQRNLGIALRSDLGAATVAGASPGVVSGPVECVDGVPAGGCDSYLSLLCSFC